MGNFLRGPARIDLLHGFIKEARKTRAKNIALALKRVKEVE
jgi:phage-related protein